MENRKKIDDLIKSELGNYAEAPPSAVWDSLEQRLDKMPSKKPGIPLFGYFAMVVVLIAISVIAVRSGSQNTNSTTNNVADNKEQTTTTNNHTQTATVDRPATGTSIGNNVAPNNEEKSGIEKNNNNSNNPTSDRLTTSPAANSNTAPASGNASGKQTGGTTFKEETRSKVAITKNKHKGRNSSGKYAAKSKPVVHKKEVPMAPPPQNAYSSSLANTNTPPENKTTDASEPQASTPANNSDSSSESRKKDHKTPPPPPPHKPKPKYTHFELGIKGGYEQGGSNDDGKKALISPYVQYKISKKLAIMLQPAVKYATVQSRVIGMPRDYYNIDKRGDVTQHTDSTPIHVVGTEQTLWKWNYSYTETHDSIVKTNVTGGTYVEFELPVLLKYYLAKDFSIYGGVNITYSQLIGLTEHTYIGKSIPRTAAETGFGTAGDPAPAPSPSLASLITYAGNPYSTYTGPQYPAPKGSLLRFGYMFGFSYEYEKRWLFDALVQQGFVSPNVQAGYNTNTPLSAPYIRLTIGYKLLSR